MIALSDVIAYVGTNGFDPVPMAKNLRIGKGLYFALIHDWKAWEPYIEQALRKTLRTSVEGAYYTFKSPLVGNSQYNTDIVVSQTGGVYTVCFAFEK